MKKNRSTVKLVLSVLCLMVGLVWTGALAIVALSGAAPAWRLLILLFFTVLFLALGIRGLLDWKKTEGKKVPRAVLIILGAVGVLLVIQMALYFPIAAGNGRMTRLLKPYVREEYTDEDVRLPENPRFVFYHNGSFSVPSKRFTLGTDDPSQVNVVAAYSESVTTNGIWVDSATGKKVSNARVQNVTLEVIRLEDWALIDKVKFHQQLKQNETGVNVLGMGEVERYLNSLDRREQKEE